MTRKAWRQLSRLLIVSAAAALIVQAAIAAPAQRTFVASTGLDTSACTLAAPCRSFATAIAHTIAGGEVIVLDSAGYGVVTVTKAISPIAPRASTPA